MYIAFLEITVDPESITVAEGSNVTLTCEATGNGTLNYQWMKESGLLPMNSLSNDGQTLTLRNIAVDDSGQYYCAVDNGEENNTSEGVQVTVRSQLITL